MVESDEVKKSNDVTQTTHEHAATTGYSHLYQRHNSRATARHSAATLPELLTGRGGPPPLHRYGLI